LEDLIEKLPLPRSLKELGVEESAVERLASDTMRLAGRSLESNPIRPSVSDLEDLFRRAYFP